MSSGQWKSDLKSPSIPGFFQARLYVDGPPKDTFIRLPVSRTASQFSGKLHVLELKTCYLQILN